MTSRDVEPSPVQLPALSARSVILSVLLGVHPPAAAVAEIIHLAEVFGVQPVATRVALTRMVAAGDLERTNATYRLTPRLLVRQQRQDRLLNTRPTEPWNRRWRVAVIVAARDTSVALTALRDQRFAELRDGVWLRPDNIEHAWSTPPGHRIETMTATPDTDPKTLAYNLFDLDCWARTATGLIDGMDRARIPRERVTLAAAIVRHLATDPLIPAELLDPGWPGPRLRITYDDYTLELAHLRNTLHPR
jgi:phenylacetic acid degradation operon negative regulatory protein